MLVTGLLICALICFVLAAFRASVPIVDLTNAGLALLVMSMLVGAF